MKIIEQRYLRGPNIYSETPCLMTLLDLQDWHEVSSASIPGFSQRLLAMLPSLRKRRRAARIPGGFIERLEQGAHFADIIAHLTMELQQLVGAQVVFSQVGEMRSAPGRYRIACAYTTERVVAAALDGALALVESLATNVDFSLHDLMQKLQRLTQRAAINPGMAAILAAAKQRGIPIQRITPNANLLQLGWGSKQRRLQATITGNTSHIAVALARDKHLAKAHVERNLGSRDYRVLVSGGISAEALFGDDNGRIPLIAVTGTNGKTTTTRLIAHTAALTGLTTGMSTTEGVYINGVRIKEGDCTGYHSARTVLSTPEVEFAVLETARGGILKRGLAFDRADISVVLNVTEDHLGLDGVETLNDLARVKRVVADTAGIVVLNADDTLCVAMASQLRVGVEHFYFSLDAENPVLLRHLEDGGRAVYLQDHMVILADGERHTGLIDARKAPLTLNGLARHNIANALAASAALAAAGFSHQDIVAGLSGFVSDGCNNPLRSNVFDVDGVCVIMDFAHNAAAYAALADMARGLSGGRLVGVVSVPGDRRDCDLQQVGEVCAAGFDDLVIYESENRGRPEGEVARLLALGARHAGADMGRLYCKIEVHHAIRFGLKLCRPGDVLVFGCASSIDELVDAISRERPDVAARIRAEVATPEPVGNEAAAIASPG